MSGPMQPAVNQLLRLPGGQTNKPGGADRVPMSNEPIQRSDASARILAARQAGVRPEQLAQPPGYQGKGNRLPLPQAPQPQTPPTRSVAPAPQEPAERVPLPQARPAGAPPREVQDPRAQALREAFIKSRGLTPQGTEPPDPREAQLAAAKERLAQAMIAQRSGGGQPAAPAVRGVVTPPAPSPAPSPAQAPPPAQQQGFRPATPSREYIVRAPELEEKGKAKPQKSTKSASNPAIGSTPNYYAILGVQPGDNQAAARKLEKLREKARSEPESLSREEYELVASTSKNPIYNMSREEQAVRDFFEKAGVKGKDQDEKVGTPKGPKSTDRVSQTGPAQGGSYAQKVPAEGTMADRFASVDPAALQAYAAINDAGRFIPPPMPTQESVNATKKFNPQEDQADISKVVEEEND